MEVTVSIWHTCWVTGETEKSQTLDLCDLWSSSCEVMKFGQPKVIQIHKKMAVTFLFLKIHIIKHFQL